MPWWAISISLYATLLTPVSFIGVAGWILEKDSRWFFGSAIIGAVVIPLAARLWVPFWAKRSYISIYQFLGERFNNAIRTAAAIVFSISTIFWLSNALVAAATAFSDITIIPQVLWILMIVGVGTTYSILGGARAVIWTDVIQFIFFTVSFVLVALFLLKYFSFDLIDIHEISSREKSIKTGYPHTQLFSAEFSFAVEASIWAILFYRATDVLTFGAQQVTMQRLLAAGSKEKMYKALFGFAAIDIIFMIILVGTAWGLLAYFVTNQEIFPKSDSAMVMFVAENMPSILRSIVLAGLLATLLSTYDSGLNSIAAILVGDFLSRSAFISKLEMTDIGISKIAVLLVSAVMLIFSILQSSTLEMTVLERIGRWNALLVGPLSTVFALGVFCKKCTSTGATVGGVASLVSTVLLSGIPSFLDPQFNGVNWMWAAGLSTVIGYLSGWLISVVFSIFNEMS